MIYKHPNTGAELTQLEYVKEAIRTMNEAGFKQYCPCYKLEPETISFLKDKGITVNQPSFVEITCEIKW